MIKNNTKRSPFNLLAGDLGGTKTLLAIYSWNDQLTQRYKRKYISAEWNSLEEMLNEFIRSVPRSIDQPIIGCIAIAGRVDKGETRITNLPWVLKEHNICKATGITKIELINDFGVLIFGLPFLKANQQVDIQHGIKSPPKEGLVAIIGAGTGLGIARGISTAEGIVSLPSEGGHSEFAPRSELEWQLTNWLKEDLKIERLSIERIVSGTGLGHIANWRLNQNDAHSHPLRKFAKDWRRGFSKKTTRPDLPALASQSALQGDPLMQEVLNLWISAYGSAAGDLALQELCTGGLWLGGGTALKQIESLSSKTFVEAFQNKGRFQQFLEGIPVRALIDPEMGLFSAACRAKMLVQSSGTLST